MTDWLAAPPDPAPPTTIPRPALRTIPGIELLKVGRWDALTGEFCPTAADLASAVAAHRAGFLRKPVIYLGHNGSLGDAEPALGYVDNLRLTDNGNTLVGDLVNVPAAMAALIPHAYPDRSIESLTNLTAADGTVYSLVLTGLALLGAYEPAVSTLRSLQDVGDLYGISIAASARLVTLSIAAPKPRPDLAVAVAAARRRRTHRIPNR